MQVHPDGKGNTTYTAYFYATEEKEWKLVASFLRPQTDTWYTHAHSFLENFNPEQGYLSRKVLFGEPMGTQHRGQVDAHNRSHLYPRCHRQCQGAS